MTQQQFTAGTFQNSINVYLNIYLRETECENVTLLWKWTGFLSKKINPFNMKRRLLYLKTQFVPHSKHFSSRL